MRAHWAGVMIAAALLAGCRADSRYVLFTSDILAVAAGGAAAPVSALYRVEISSMSDCEEKQAAIMAIVARYFDLTSAARCDGGEDESWLEFAARADLVAYGALPPGNAPLGLAAEPVDGGAQLLLTYDASRFGALSREVEALELGATVELGTLALEVMHDGALPIWLSGPAAWVDDAPSVMPALALGPLDTITLRLSDVTAAVLQAEGSVVAFSLESVP